MDIAYYDNLWQPNKRERAASEAFWDGRADHFKANAYKRKDGGERLAKLLALLKAKGMLSKSGSVLDIGCGPGKYALELAKAGKEVIGIDISARMLAHAEESGKEANLENLQFIKLDWEQVSLEEQNWVRRFDLVFASMCPAINSKNALEKMSRASRGHCFMSTFARRTESIRDRLAEKLLPDWSLQTQGKGVYCAFNLLWLLGYHPEITYLDSNWENTFSREEAMEYYCAALPIPGGPTKMQREFIESYLQEQGDQGTITERVEAKFAWICWKV